MVSGLHFRGPRASNTYQTTNDTTQVKDDPKPGDKLALGLFIGIAHHDNPLSSPQTTSAHTKQRTRKDQEAGIMIVVVRENRCNVEKVAETTEEQRCAKSQTVSDRARKEAYNGKSRVQRGIGLADVVRVEPATGTQAIDSVEHTGA